MGNLIIETETGSLYELDNKEKRIRRMHGTKDPTPRQGKDGEWKQIKNAIQPVEGKEMIFLWRVDYGPNEYEAEIVFRTTISSRVVSITESQLGN